jgi:hypothetical protein
MLRPPRGGLFVRDVVVVAAPTVTNKSHHGSEVIFSFGRDASPLICHRRKFRERERRREGTGGEGVMLSCRGIVQNERLYNEVGSGFLQGFTNSRLRHELSDDPGKVKSKLLRRFCRAIQMQPDAVDPALLNFFDASLHTGLTNGRRISYTKKAS